MMNSGNGSPAGARPDGADKKKGGLFAGLFGRKKKPVPQTEELDNLLPPPPRVSQAPATLVPPKGMATQLRNALKAPAPGSPKDLPPPVAARPASTRSGRRNAGAGSRFVPSRMLKLPKEALSILRKTPPKPVVTETKPQAEVQPATKKNPTSTRFRPESRFARKDYPII